MTQLSNKPPAPILPLNENKKMDQTPIIPPIPKKKEKKQENEDIKIKVPSLKPNKMTETENLYWKLAWLQFIVISLGFWAALIQSYNVEIAETSGFWAGVGSTNVKIAIYGTVSAFSNVVIGGIMKLYNQRIDQKQRKEEHSRAIAEREERERRILEDENRKKEKRILDLETQLLNLSMKLIKKAENQERKK